MFRAIRRGILTGLSILLLSYGYPVIGGMLTFLAIGTMIDDFYDDHLPEIRRSRRERTEQLASE